MILQISGSGGEISNATQDGTDDKAYFHTISCPLILSFLRKFYVDIKRGDGQLNELIGEN